MFAVCMQAELVPASVQDYRDKLLHLRKLRHDLVQRSLPNGPPGTFQQVRPPPLTVYQKKGDMQTSDFFPHFVSNSLGLQMIKITGLSCF